MAFGRHPMICAAEIRTPTLVIHDQGDYRVDLSEGLQMFTTLQRQGIPLQPLCFPDEGHRVHKLSNQLFAYEAPPARLFRSLQPAGP